MLTNLDEPLARELFRRAYGVELGTHEANDAIGRPRTTPFGIPTGTYWKNQIEWITQDQPWAYDLVYDESCRTRWANMPAELQTYEARAALSI